jgi:HEAT repeat protein
LLKKNGTRAAVEALGAIGDARAIGPLIAVLKDRHSDACWDAARVLGQIGDARAVEPLIAALTQHDRPMRQAAAKSLVTLYKSRVLGEVHKQLILAQRGRISAVHSDWTPPACSNQHHTDEGIGVAFPV